MTLEEKRTVVSEYCTTTNCVECALRTYPWSTMLRMGCLPIGSSLEEDLDKALELIGYVDKTVETYPSEDVVNRPKHYTDGKIEVIEFIEDKKLGFCLGNAIKYIARAGKKDPAKEVEDLKKARWYIDRRIKELENE